MDRQVRLLWDLSNKRNKRDITNIKAQLKEIEESFTSLKGQISPISAKQRASDLEIAKLEKSLEKLSNSLTDLSSESNSDIEKRINDQEEAISSIDAFRRQINSNILNLQRQIDEFRKELNNSSLE